MGKKTSGLLAFVACAAALCLALVGCASAPKANPEEKFLGYWELVSGTAAGEELSEDDVSQLKDWGVNFIVHLDKDGRAEMDLFGQVDDTTWDAEKATIKVDDEVADLKVDGDELVLSQGEDTPPRASRCPAPRPSRMPSPRAPAPAPPRTSC